MQQVRPGRVAIIAGVLVAAFVVAAYVVRTVPDGVVALVGGPDGGIDRIGGLRLHYRPAPESDPRYLRALAEQTEIKRDGDQFVLEFPGIDQTMAGELAEILSSGGLTFKETLETDYAHQIGPSAEVTVEEDDWVPDEGERHTNAYLRGPTPEAIERAIAAAKARGWQQTPGTEILFEQVIPSLDADDQSPYWRSYEVVAKAELDGSMIASARSSFDPYTNRPLVLLDFTKEGAEVFGNLTERIVGRKLATVLGNRVASAPIINSAIRGGSASITMGGNDAQEQQREADMLVAVLRRGSLPLSGTVSEVKWFPASDVTSYEWLGRLVMGAIAGIGFGLIVFVTLRFARPRWGTRPTLPEGGGTLPWRRIAVTMVAPIVLIAGSWITLPGINRAELEYLPDGAPTSQFSVLALGITPILIAFFLVELVAFVIPALRWRRHDPVGRVRLGQAVALLAILLALTQAYFITVNLEIAGRMGSFASAFGYGDLVLVTDPGWAFRIGAMASLVTGTLVLAVVAGMVREHGLGNGYGVIFLAGSLIDFLRIYVDEPTYAPELLARDALGLVAIVVIAAFTAAVLRWRVAPGREPALRLPTSGMSPIGDSLALAYAFALISMFGLGTDLPAMLMRLSDLQSRTSVIFAVVIVTVPIWSWLFARPKLVPGATNASWLRATAVSLVLLVAIVAIQWFAVHTNSNTAAIVNAMNIMIGTAVLLDMRDDLRAHRQQLAPAAVLHQIQRAGIAERVLTDAGIPFHVHAGHLRSLFAFFGPFAPAIVMVPEVHAIEARGKLAEANQITTPPRAIAKID
jgi:hypothetical protein